MTTIELIHRLTVEEVNILKSLVGKSICAIQSDSICLNPFKPELYPFTHWIEIVLWDNLELYHFKYEFGETPSGDDFIKLNIRKETQAKRKAKNVSLRFDNFIFIVDKIEVYGDSYVAELKADKRERVVTENIIVIESKKGEKICIQCLYPYLDVNVTLDKELILKTLDNLRFVNPKVQHEGSTLKYTFK